MTVEERASVLKFRPEMATSNAGSFDFGLYPVASRFVLGVVGANAAEPDQLVHMLRTAERLFGRDASTWSGAGVGYPGEFHLAGLSLMTGGNVRVGLEDNLRLRRREAAGSNADLVRKVVTLADLYDRTPAEAREQLGLERADAVAF